MAYQNKPKTTFIMENADGDRVIADKDCEAAVAANGFKRVRGGGPPTIVPDPVTDDGPQIDKAALGRLSKDQLLDLCHEHDLDLEGTKPVLVERLAKAGVGPVKE